MKRVILLITLLPLGAFASVSINLWGDIDFFVFDATPVEDVSMYGAQLDVVLPSPGDISMGFGVEAHYVTSDASFLGVDYTNSLGLYAVGVYSSPLTSVLDFLVISRGGISIPSMDFSEMGYFTEVMVGVTYPISKSFRISLGASMKSYSFGKSYITFIPLKMGIGGEL